MEQGFNDAQQQLLAQQAFTTHHDAIRTAGNEGMQSLATAPPLQHAVGVPLVPPGCLGLQCVRCLHYFAIPAPQPTPTGISGHDTSTLIAAAMLCFIGCWPCAVCVLLGETPPTQRFVQCPNCGVQVVF
eukprot:GEMP01060716.1.p1 GENE.GEMP01060716.1~~GEMP01060716.1.p1  ORF type:complete len:143 (+),score=24.27 GEMP01060716.1:45-431(+)